MSVIIIGAGPSGLATAACLAARGVRARLVDRSGEPGGAYREMHAAMELASPTALNDLPGLPQRARERYEIADEYRGYLERYARHHALSIERAEVAKVERSGGRFAVTLRDGEALAASAVVVATGIWSHPWAPALPLGALDVMHASAWRGVAACPHERLLIVGGGMSGIEIATEAARAGRQVWLSVRSPVKLIPSRLLGVDLHYWVRPFEWLPTLMAPSFCRRPYTFKAADHGYSHLVRAGRIELRGVVTGSEGRRVKFAEGAPATVDGVVLATGFRDHVSLLPPEVARLPLGRPRTHACESVSWPGLYVIGLRCVRGIDSEVLRGIASDAKYVAQRIAREDRHARLPLP